MANHPYNNHREQQVAHRRVDKILSAHPEGAKKHMAGPAYSQITSKSAAVRDDDVRGHSAPKRFARGGKVKGDTNISIVLPGAAPKPPMPIPVPMGGPPPGPGPGLPPGLPPGPPPGMGPGGPPPGMPPGMPPGLPMRARGGKVEGIATKANNASWSKRASDNSYLTGGAITGVGRQQKAANAKRK